VIDMPSYKPDTILMRIIEGLGCQLMNIAMNFEGVPITAITQNIIDKTFNNPSNELGVEFC
jgi:hypothetical protein